MIDTAKRKVAADLVRRFRDGDLTNDELEMAWPEGREDIALPAIESMLWRFYDDEKEYALVGKRAANDWIRNELSRYASFLDTDLPYEWSETKFDQLGGIGLLGIFLSLGVLLPLDLWIRVRNARRVKRMALEGDVLVWPYLRAADLRRYAPEERPEQPAADRGLGPALQGSVAVEYFRTGRAVRPLNIPQSAEASRSPETGRESAHDRR